MPFIKAVIFAKWVDVDGSNSPDAIDDIYSWAIANNEGLPLEPNVKGRYQDITGQANVHQKILDDLAIFVAQLEITTATAAQFAADPRIWTLGYRRYNDEGEETFSNWNEPLTAEERTQAINYVTSNSKITQQQIVAVFDAGDTRREIAQKLKQFFRDE
jgi:hypothetical protein